MKIEAKIFIVIALFLPLHQAFGFDKPNNPQEGWKAGVSRVAITPKESMWMAGYGSRDHASEGTLHELWAKALFLEDSNGKRAVLVTTDLVGIPEPFSNRIRERLKEKFHLSKDQIILSSSHTHTGPVLANALQDIYPLDDAQLNKVKNYTVTLEIQMIKLVGDAIRSLRPVKIYAGNGTTRFQVNRRNNNESLLNNLTILNGPNDYSVPVIKVENEDGRMLAVVFGYACHATVLSSYKWSGDYPGFAQIELEKLYPGTISMFFQGAGADLNPLPRGTVQFARQYGRELAAAVDNVLNDTMRRLSSTLSTEYSEVQLSFVALPSGDELRKMAETSGNYKQRWATRLLKQLNEGIPLMTSYPYPVQVWKLGGQMIVGLGGEVVVEYSIKLKQLFNKDLFVLGYVNDVMAYIPSISIIKEGGYEGATSQFAYGLPGIWKSDTELLILMEVVTLAKRLGLEVDKTKLVGK